MGITINFFGILLSSSHPQDGSADLVMGPLEVWLGGGMLFGLTLKGRFSFICEATGYRPEGGKWFETWTEPDGARNGYLLGHQWRLLTEQQEAVGLQ